MATGPPHRPGLDEPARVGLHWGAPPGERSAAIATRTPGNDTEPASGNAAPRRPGPDFWQRRYLLRHYLRHSDATLARGTGLSEPAVAAFLARTGATRPEGLRKRLAAAGPTDPPELLRGSTFFATLTSLHTRPLQRADWFLVAGAFVASAVLYVATSARTVTGEDAGEFLAAAHVFGVPHPPGYPLWLLLSWLADHALPFGTTAFRVTLVSSLPSAAAVALVAALGLKLFTHRLAALGAAGLFAVSLTHWTQAVIPEVYGLNSCFIALQIVLLLRLAEVPSAGRFVALAFVTGLAATNHTTAFPVGGVMAVGALAVAPRLLRRPGVLAVAVAAGVVPLLLYLVLPLASARDPYIDWGNPETAEALWAHVTRAQYATVEAEQQSSAADTDAYLRRLAIVGEAAARQFGGGAVLLLAAVGVVALFLRQTGVCLVLLAIGWLCSVGVTRFTAFSFDREHLYANAIFWIPAWMALSVFLGGGLDALASLALRGQAVPRRGAAVLVGLLVAALVAWPALRHFPLADRSATTTIESFGRAILEVLPEGALYFPASDHSTFPVLYVQGVLGVRPDVVLADKYGRIERDLIERMATEEDRLELAAARGRELRATEERVLIRRWPGAVAFANRRPMHDLPELDLVPYGPIFRVVSRAEAHALFTPDAEGRVAALEVWEPLGHLLDVPAHERVDFTVQMVHGDMLYMRGFAALRAGRVDEAQQWWSRMEADLAPMKQILNNTGSALAEAGRLQDAVDFYARALQEDPRYVLALRNKAITHRRMGQIGEAIDLLGRAVVADPKARALRIERARLLAESDRPVEALAEYETLARDDRRDPLPWREAGDVLAQVGDLRKARDAYEEALRLAPGQASVTERLERVKRDLSRPKEVAGVEDSVDPGDPLAVFGAGGGASPPQPSPVMPPARAPVAPVPKVGQLPEWPGAGAASRPMLGPEWIFDSGHALPPARDPN